MYYPGIESITPYTLSPNRYSCEVCKQRFWLGLKYAAHMLAKHDTVVNSYTCALCSNKYFRKEQYEDHLLSNEHLNQAKTSNNINADSPAEKPADDYPCAEKAAEENAPARSTPKGDALSKSIHEENIPTIISRDEDVRVNNAFEKISVPRDNENFLEKNIDDADENYLDKKVELKQHSVVTTRSGRVIKPKEYFINEI